MGEDRKMGHVQPFKTYMGVFGGLLILTVITYAVSYMHSGIMANAAIHMGVALIVATIKATLVVRWFMHAKFEGAVTHAFIYYPVIILIILVSALFLDYGYRDSDDDYLVKPASITADGKYGGDHGGEYGTTGDDGEGHEEETKNEDHGEEGGDQGSENPDDQSQGDDGDQ
jgi:cytochrome c oxidase subunit 4